MSLSESCAVGTDDPVVRDLTIGDALREAAAAAPQRPALVAGSADPAARRQWSYSELLAQSEEVAHALLARFPRLARLSPPAPSDAAASAAAPAAAAEVEAAEP